MPKRKTKSKAARSVEVSEEAAKVLEEIKQRTCIPKVRLVEIAVLNYLPRKYKGVK